MTTTLRIFDNGQQQIPLKTITHLSGVGNYTLVHRTVGKPILLAHTLKRLEEKLPGFIRIHKKHLVNPLFVDIDQRPYRDQLILRLTSGQALAVARRRLTGLYRVLYGH